MLSHALAGRMPALPAKRGLIHSQTAIRGCFKTPRFLTAPVFSAESHTTFFTFMRLPIVFGRMVSVPSIVSPSTLNSQTPLYLLFFSSPVSVRRSASYLSSMTPIGSGLPLTILSAAIDTLPRSSGGFVM